MIKVAVLGYGTVGSGVVEVIERNHTKVNASAGEELQVKYILDLRDFPGDPWEEKVVHDYQVILADDEVSIICETMGGVGAAYQFTKQALEAGKSVCTSNKELVAKHGAELLAVAAANHCNYMFEASVGGGIPIIRTINSSLTAEKLEAVVGILNGTTNYILTQIQENPEADYAESLKAAQELGYAERNPAADVEGHDACRKVAILSSLMAGRNVDPEKIYTEGITNVSRADFDFALAEGMTIKLLALSRIEEDGRLLAMVAPFMLPMTHPLARVNDVFNGILVTGNMLGDAMLYGRGAGKLPTASAVAADVIECGRNPSRTVVRGWTQEEAGLADIGETCRRFFVRARISRREAVEAAFPGGKVCAQLENHNDCAVITPKLSEKEFEARYSALGDAVLGRIRLL